MKIGYGTETSLILIHFFEDKFQHAGPGQFHFNGKSQVMSGIDRDHAIEIQCVPYTQLTRMTASAAQTDTAYEQVDCTAQLP